MRRMMWSLAAMTLLLSGCETFECMSGGCNRHEHNASSLVQFLYPHGNVPRNDEVPQLHLPLRVGLAFLPPPANSPVNALDEPHQQDLLEKIRARFISRKFVADIVIIPDYYLASAQGYEGLEGVQRLYGVDLMALVSYDQVAHTNDNAGSLAYWTVVGAYFWRGTRDEVSTLVDLAVVDPKTRTLVLRAGGADSRHETSTLVGQEVRLRKDEGAGFYAATTQMIDHFDGALTRFEGEVRAGTANVRVAEKNAGSSGAGNGGGGSLDGFMLLALLPLAWRRHTM